MAKKTEDNPEQETAEKPAKKVEAGIDASNVNKKFDGEANPHRPKQKGGDEDAAFQGTAAYVRKTLKEQPKRRIFIPSTPGEPKDTMHPFNINGYTVYVKKGVYVEVPETIADLAEASQNQTEAAVVNPVSSETGEPLNLNLASQDVKDALTYS